MAGLSLSDMALLRRLHVEAATIDRQIAPVETAVDSSASRLLDLLVGAGVESGESVKVNGIRYRFDVEGEELTSTTAERRQHAMVTADGKPLLPGPASAETAHRFLSDLDAISTAFATNALHEMDREMNPHASPLRRVEVACAALTDHLLGRPGSVQRTVIDDLADAASTTGAAGKASELRPVRVAVTVAERVAGHLLHSRAPGAVLLAGSATAAGAGAPLVLAAATVGLGLAMVAVGDLRERGERRRMVTAARSRLTLEQRVNAVDSLRALKSRGPVVPATSGQAL